MLSISYKGIEMLRDFFNNIENKKDPPPLQIENAINYPIYNRKRS
jgi:hypothetical protein